MFKNIDNYENKISENLVVKSINKITDIDRVTELNEIIHKEGDFFKILVLHHPYVDAKNILYVEDITNGKIVSTIMLIEWNLNFCGIKLKSAEMAIVSTLPEYRKQGLISKLNERFSEILFEDNYSISMIQGIPYYYRQYNYHYAIPLEINLSLELYKIEEYKNDNYKIRLAYNKDIKKLMELYNDEVKSYDINAIRDEKTWKYLLNESNLTSLASEFYLICDKNNKIISYFKILKQGFFEGLILSECSNMSAEEIKFALSFCKELSLERKKPYIRVNIARKNVLFQYAIAIGAKEVWSYAWQIKIVSKLNLLNKMIPVFEERINNSIYKNLTTIINLNFYKETISITFENGKIVDISEIFGCDTNPDIMIPPDLFVPIITGYRSIDKLKEFHHDLFVNDLSSFNRKDLLNVLFPQLDSYIYLAF